MPTFSIGIGSEVEIGRGATPTWTKLVGVQDITLPTSTADKIDVTHMGSPNFTKQYIRGLKDNGDVTLEIIWEPGSPTDVLLQGLEDSEGEIVQIRFTVTGATAPFVYRGFLSSYGKTAPVQDKLMTEAVFSISEKVTV